VILVLTNLRFEGGVEMVSKIKNIFSRISRRKEKKRAVFSRKTENVCCAERASASVPWIT
jgi:hypothetical protein